jgi:neutral ceramidase
MRAGAARISLEPPLGLPMIGFVRMTEPARDYGLPLEATALVLDGEARVVLVGVDTLGIQAPEVDRLRERVAEAAGTKPSHVLLNWNHTHLAPPGGRSFIRALAQVDDTELTTRLETYVDDLHAAIVAVARGAAERLEPARVVWGLGSLPDAVNRRERRDGRVVLGWNPEGAVDRSVTVLQARRPDESAIGTLVGYGCHTVTTGPDVPIYSADYPGALRDAVRTWTGGECVFFQGAAGNVLPLVCFTGSEEEAMHVGRGLALEALHAVAQKRAWPVRIEREGWGSVTPISLYRRHGEDAPEQPIAVAEERAAFPLQPLPAVEEIGGMRAEFEAAVEASRADGPARVRTAAYHARWAQQTEEKLRSGTAPTELDGPITAVRVGDGVIATGPGEIFTEIGLAVKERSPVRATLYAGYTNGIVTYFPTAAEFPLGGYEPDYGNRSFGQVAQVTPESEAILTETAVRLVRGLFA